MKNQHNSSEKCTFELLSAYLDGEVTPSEREEVKQLLAEDAETQQLYRRLQILRDSCQTLPTPESQISATDLANTVFANIDGERKNRKRLLWGGGAIAAMLVAAIGSIFSESNNPVFQFAQKQDESLIIALNQPLIDMTVENEVIQTESLMLPLNHSLIEIPNNNE